MQAHPRSKGREAGAAALALGAALLVSPFLAGNADAIEHPVQNLGSDLAATYFPMHVGDTWIYVRTGAGNPDATREVSVLADNHGVCAVAGYGFRVQNAVYQFQNVLDETREVFGGQVAAWYRWNDLDGAVQLPGFTGGCLHGSSGRFVRTRILDVPAGRFEHVITVLYDTWPCSDSGVLSESFAPRVGLIQREVLTIAGVERWSLANALIDGIALGANLDNDKPAAAGVAAAATASSSWGAIKSIYAR